MLLLCFLLFCLLLENQLTGEVAKTPSNISTPFVFVVSPKLNLGKKKLEGKEFQKQERINSTQYPRAALTK